MRLAVNIDHVATVRQARRAKEPDPVTAAAIAELAGAEGITVHLRSDRRHIQDRDVEILRQTVRTRLNVEMAATREMVRVALSVKPDQVTLVPERREELTTEGGLDVLLHAGNVEKVLRELEDARIAVSIFVDPDLDQIRGCARLGVRRIEINTGRYAEAWDSQTWSEPLDRIRTAAKGAKKVGLTVFAGHGLDYRNIGPIAEIEEIEELNIGHAIMARAILTGLDSAVREMVALMRRAR